MAAGGIRLVRARDAYIGIGDLGIGNRESAALESGIGNQRKCLYTKEI